MSVPRLLRIFRSQLGVVESPPGSNEQPYGRAYGMPRVAWCAQLVWWGFREAGLSHLIPKTAYTPTFANWFRQHHRWGTTPRVGAVAFFDFPGDGVDRISHVGIVEAVNPDGSVICIEGNTSPGGGGSQRDGGGVFRRTRKTGIVGYGYPLYPASTDAPADAPPANRKDEDVLRIPIAVQPDGRFHEATMVEAGGSSQVVQRAWCTYGSVWGSAELVVTALGSGARVLKQWKHRMSNNDSGVVDLPAATTMVTVEGKAESPGTRVLAAVVMQPR